MLAERRAQILGHIVSEYVSTAMPVGSATVVHKFGLPISPATVRNEMARLEEEGFITHPHTSAGRIPSDKGYRFYIESLMEEEELPWPERQTIRQRLYRMVDMTGRAQLMEEQAHIAAMVLAETVRNAAVATVPRAPRCRLQHVELVELSGSRVLVVAVFSGAYVRRQVVALTEPVEQDPLTGIANRLSELYANLTTDDLGVDGAELSPMEERVSEALLELMAEEDRALYDQAYLEGLRNVLSQPEFAQTDAVIDLLCVLEEGNLMRVLPLEALAGEGVTVVIGEENREDVMHRCSVVVTRYGVPGMATGALAVLGPTRMAYSRIIPTVRYLSSLMGQLVAQG
jgi:heat-inducible transcriptional repressor